MQDENLQVAEQRIAEAAQTRATSLSLSKIPLKTLPESIGELTDLQILFAKDCGLQEIPPCIGRLKRLTALHLVNNRIFTLPAEIGQLSYLKELYLTGNQLTLLPNSLRYLTRLREFYADQNQLIGLPEELSELATLEILWLGHNTLAEFPRELCGIRTLKLLGLSDNRLAELPAELGTLERLEKLYVANNQLTALPENLGECQHLTLVDARNNGLERLPASLGQRSELREIYLHGNPALDLPELILGSTPEQVKAGGMPPTEAFAVLQYYFTQDAAARSQLCLETAARGASVARARAEEAAIRPREQEAREAAAHARPTVAKPTSLAELEVEPGDGVMFTEKIISAPDAQAWAEAHAQVSGTPVPAPQLPQAAAPPEAVDHAYAPGKLRLKEPDPEPEPEPAPRERAVRQAVSLPENASFAPTSGPLRPGAIQPRSSAAPAPAPAPTPERDLAPVSEPAPSALEEPSLPENPRGSTPGGYSGHFLDRSEEAPRPKAASREGEGPRAATIGGPSIQAPPQVRLRTLSEIEEEEKGGRGGWGKKLFGGLLGKKKKDDDVIK